MCPDQHGERMTLSLEAKQCTRKFWKPQQRQPCAMSIEQQRTVLHKSTLYKKIKLHRHASLRRGLFPESFQGIIFEIKGVVLSIVDF